MPSYKEAAEALWAIIDDIDTASDRCKSDDAAYRRLVERLQRKRFEWFKPDTEGRSLLTVFAVSD